MRARHVVRKTALININNQALVKRVITDYHLENTPGGFARLGVFQRFFLQLKPMRRSA